jgi:uncharacterized protein (UPF0333 family)
MAEERSATAWWKQLLVGLIMLAITGYFYWEFSNFENAAAETRSMSKVLTVLYNSIGKYVIYCAFGSIGVVLCLLGSIDSVRSNKKTAVVTHKPHPNFNFDKE